VCFHSGYPANVVTCSCIHSTSFVRLILTGGIYVNVVFPFMAVHDAATKVRLRTAVELTAFM
jgi:hypothetical protein